MYTLREGKKKKKQVIVPLQSKRILKCSMETVCGSRELCHFCAKWASNFQCSCYYSFLYLCQLISSLILLLLQLASPQNRRGLFTCYSQYPLTDCQGSKHMPSTSLYLLQLWFNFLKYLCLHLQGWEQTVQMETSRSYRRENAVLRTRHGAVTCHSLLC